MKASAAPSVVKASATPYRAVPLANPGAVAGTVSIQGSVPADTVVHPAVDQAVCGAQLVDETIVRAGNHLADVVVWLPDVHEGKPMPLERRFELTNDHCQLLPRVQAVVAGGTLNVRNLDAATHRTRFVRLGTGEHLTTITATEPGAVVPDETILDEAGQIEIGCEVHPWTRAWILVFDHPYATVTARDGTFRLDGVPPGRWRILAWHERFGLLEDSIIVAPGQEARVELKVGK